MGIHDSVFPAISASAKRIPSQDDSDAIPGLAANGIHIAPLTFVISIVFFRSPHLGVRYALAEDKEEFEYLISQFTISILDLFGTERMIYLADRPFIVPRTVHDVEVATLNGIKQYILARLHHTEVIMMINDPLIILHCR